MRLALGRVSHNGDMWRRAGVILVWVLATIGTASVTLAAVSRVGGEVTNRPAVPVSAEDLVLASVNPAAPAVAPGTEASSPAPITTTAAVDWVGLDPPTTSMPPESDPVVTPSGGTEAPQSSSATEPATTAATTTQPPAPPAVTTVLIGGTVTVQQNGGSVTLISAVPASGFTADVEAAGPSEVQVEFKSPGHESKYAARVEGGQLSVSTEEGDDD